MVKGIYSIYDRKAEIYHEPMIQMNNLEAIRTVGDVVNNPKTAIHAHPEDYSLYRCGEFNMKTGELKGKLLQKLCEAEELLTKGIKNEDS